jgi:hypothetical protein
MSTCPRHHVPASTAYRHYGCRCPACTAWKRASRGRGTPAPRQAAATPPSPAPPARQEALTPAQEALTPVPQPLREATLPPPSTLPAPVKVTPARAVTVPGGNTAAVPVGRPALPTRRPGPARAIAAPRVPTRAPQAAQGTARTRPGPSVRARDWRTWRAPVTLPVTVSRLACGHTMAGVAPGASTASCFTCRQVARVVGSAYLSE